MTLLDRLFGRTALRERIEVLERERNAADEFIAGLEEKIELRNEELLAVRRENVSLKPLQRQVTQLREENDGLKAKAADLLQHAGSREMDPERGDPAARRLLGRLFKHEPFSDNCMIGPQGCESHYREGGDCTVAWLKAWVAGHIATPPGITALALTMTGVHDATDVMVEALGEYAANHAVAGADEGQVGVVWRHKLRIANSMAHAVQSDI